MKKVRRKIDAVACVQPMVDAFSCKTDREAVRFLVMEATRAIYGYGTDRFSHRVARVTDAELEAVLGSMRLLDPKDAVELLLCSQAIVCQLLGFRRLQIENGESIRLGCILLRTSAEVLEALARKRGTAGKAITLEGTWRTEKGAGR